MRNFELGNKVVAFVDDHSNDRGMGPNRVKVYGYITKINKATCDITLVDKTTIRKYLYEVALYVDPFLGFKYKDLK